MRLLLLIALVFIAGCVGPSAKVDINNGVIIEKFTADPADVFDFQTVTFSVDISNVGGTTANDVKVKLLGVEGAWRPQSGPSTSTVSESQVTRPTSGTLSLKPPRIKDNIPGDSRFFDFILTAPNLNEGDKTTFPVKARVEFSYATTGSVIVKAISLNQQQILQRRGESILEPVTESNSDGPLKFRFVRGSAPLIIDPDEGTTIEREFRFEISNVGQGWPISDDVVGKVGGVSPKGDKIELRAPVGIRLVRCEGFTTGSEASFSATLRSDGKAPISCTISIDTAAWRTKTEESLVFNIELNYKYFVESDVSVGVQGTKRDDIPVRSAPGVSAPAPGATPAPGVTPVAGPPTIVQTIPSSGATNVELRPTILITFNKLIDQNSIPSSVFLSGPAGNIPGSIFLSGDAKGVAFIPTNPLSADTLHTVTVTAVIKSTDGFNLAAPHTFTFRTITVDTTPPQLFNPSPALDAVVNTRTVSISMSTNEAATCRILATGQTFSSVDGRAHSLTLTNLQDAQHTFVIRCKDAANNENLPANDLTIRFTVDATAPTVSSTTPVATPQQTGVSKTGQIIITFSEPMDTAATEAAFSIAPSVAGTKTWNAQQTQLFFSPSAAMVASTEHTVTISTGAKDKANNPLAQAFTFKFTTGT